MVTENGSKPAGKVDPGLALCNSDLSLSHGM